MRTFPLGPICISTSRSRAGGADCLWSCNLAKGWTTLHYLVRVELANKLQGALCGWHCDKWCAKGETEGEGEGKLMDNWKAESATKLADEEERDYCKLNRGKYTIISHTHPHIIKSIRSRLLLYDAAVYNSGIRWK